VRERKAYKENFESLSEYEEGKLCRKRRFSEKKPKAGPQGGNRASRTVKRKRAKKTLSAKSPKKRERTKKNKAGRN